MKLLGLTDFKSRAGINSSTDDTLLSTLIDGVSARIETALRRTLTKAAYTETVRPNGRIVSVKAYPIDTQQSVTVTEYSNSVWASSEYDVDDQAGQIMLLWTPFTYQDFRSVTVAYTGGYAETGDGEREVLGGAGRSEGRLRQAGQVRVSES